MTATRTHRFPGLLETHREVRARLGLAVDENAVEALLRRFRPPAWVTGTIGALDALFLYDMVHGTRPRRIVEVGVASGCSTAVMLMALADAGLPLVDDRGVATLHGFDFLDHCYFDRTRPLASGARELVPDLYDALALHPGETAEDAARCFADEPLSFAFIDADHRHPYPTADLLALAPIMAPGAWVALHDVNLVAVAEAYEQRTGERVEWHHRGAQVLFEAWPFEKMRSRGDRNIGAVRMPADRVPTADDLRAAIERPWETDVPAAVERRLGMRPS